MAKKEKEKAILKIEDNEYSVDEMNDEEKIMFNHVADLTRKIDTMNFNMQQLQFGKKAFVTELKNSLERNKEK